MTAEIRGGFILLSRKLLTSGIMEKPALYLKLWAWMLLQATHTERGTLKRGQFFTTIDDMRRAMAYKIGYRETMPTEKQIRRAYGFKIDSGMIEIQKKPHGIIISILNFDTYQNPENYKTKENQHCQNKGHTEGHDEGQTQNAESPCKQRSESFTGEHEGHDEGRDDARTRGTLYNKKGINKNDKPLLDFLNRYAGEERTLIDQTLQAIAATRQGGKIADTVKVKILQQFEKFDRQQVFAGCRTYLEKQYHLDGKKENYLFGIIHNKTAEPAPAAPARAVSEFDRALEKFNRNQTAQGAAQ